MSRSALGLSREDVLAFRRRVGALDERLPAGAESLRRAAWAGLQDSMPRAALLSIQARVAGTTPSTWEDASLVQVWGPRFSAFVVSSSDAAIFTLGRLPDDPRRRREAEELADRVETFLAGRRLAYGEVGRALGVHPNALRYAAPTGRVVIRWDGARQPTIWTVPPPAIDPAEARRELARRYLHVFGPATYTGFADWAGISPARARAAFDDLEDTLIPVRTPIGDRVALATDEDALRAMQSRAAGARLLPSGDAYSLLHGRDRELLVPDAARRGELWTPRVWPGAVLVDGEIRGTWRRAQSVITIQPWGRLAGHARTAVEEEATSLPLRGADGRIVVRWQDPS